MRVPIFLGLVAMGGLLSIAACGSDSSQFDGSNSSSSGASSGASSGIFGGSGGTSSGTFAGCATASKKAARVPVDMLIGLDTSFSMDFDNKWTNVRDALTLFVQNPAYSDLGFGLQFFPIRKQCSIADYANPAVPIALQPQAAMPIMQALGGQSMAGGTPMVPLLEGLAQYLAANAKPDRRPVILLATDGYPDDNCVSPDLGLPNSLENAVAVVDAAYKGNPSIATFVIGVGKELTALDAIAAAGGTTKAALVDTGANAQANLLTALNEARREAIPCDFDIPPGTIDVNETNVTYTTHGMIKDLAYVGNEAGCAKLPDGTGWYFDDENAPKKVVLCKAVCDLVKQDDSGSVDLIFGCPRVETR
jgi:hypothetical protein